VSTVKFRTPLVTHRFDLTDLKDAYDLFSHQRDGVMKVALYPNGIPAEAETHRTTVSAIL
jgi:hypothetical protein